MNPKIAALRSNIGKAFVGKPDLISNLLVTLLAGGHALLEDVPGVGKTTLARSLARSLDATFRRIQFTPDLLPSDVTGVSVYEKDRGAFVFKPGPIFGNVVLADEINRTNPRTQSALLEAMNDRQVSVDGESHFLPAPFMVLATQNPYEFEGVYPLPESQLDRFLMRLEVGYPARDEEREVLASRERDDPLEKLMPAISGADVVALQGETRDVKVEASIIDYILDIVHATRESERLHVGVSPRGSLALRRAVQARALVEGRTFAIPDDVKRLAVPVLGHRVIPKGRRVAGTSEGGEAIAEIVARAPVPT